MAEIDRDEFISHLKPVRDLEPNDFKSVRSLVEAFSKVGGFTAAKIHEGALILKEMIEDKNSFNFLSFPAAPISTGLRGVIREFVKRKYFNAIITTTGTIDHDLARCFKDYYKGRFEADDNLLRDLEIHRLGNVFIPFENYGMVIEEHTQKLLEGLYNRGQKELATYELLRALGEYLENCPNKEESIIWWAYKNEIDIFVPGITDGAFGYQIWLFREKYRDFRVNVLKDESRLSDIVYENEVTGALIIGGGISKHHVIWWNQFKGGLNRTVYITTAPEWDGSLSGAKTREAISWGKISKRANHITIEGEATAILPLIAGYLFEVIPER